MDPPRPEFVRVKDRRFVVGDQDAEFRFLGTNIYYLIKHAVHACTRHLVDEVLDTAKIAGMTVVRMWGFSDGRSDTDLQTAPGVYNESVFRGLDYVLDAAGKRGLRILLVLTNYWPDFGGMTQYVKWTSPHSLSDVCITSEAFYESSAAFNAFAQFLRTIISRRNSITGQLYRDDPTILAWSVANEPRCMGDETGNKLYEFLLICGQLIKSLDPNHLLTHGSEGFFGPSTPDLMQYNPYNTSDHGTDFVRHFTMPEYDFISFHMWVDNWGISSQAAKLKFADIWITSHVEASHAYLPGKPLVLTEYGKKSGEGRIEFFEKVLEKCCRSIASTECLSGLLFWHLATPDYPDYDFYTIYTSRIPHKSQADQRAIAPASIPPDALSFDDYARDSDDSDAMSETGSSHDHTESLFVLEMCSRFYRAVEMGEAGEGGGCAG